MLADRRSPVALSQVELGADEATLRLRAAAGRRARARDGSGSTIATVDARAGRRSAARQERRQRATSAQPYLAAAINADNDLDARAQRARGPHEQRDRSADRARTAARTRRRANLFIGVGGGQRRSSRSASA